MTCRDQAPACERCAVPVAPRSVSSQFSSSVAPASPDKHRLAVGRDRHLRADPGDRPLGGAAIARPVVEHDDPRLHSEPLVDGTPLSLGRWRPPPPRPRHRLNCASATWWACDRATRPRASTAPHGARRTPTRAGSSTRRSPRSSARVRGAPRLAGGGRPSVVMTRKSHSKWATSL
jgi:hypothetical protein